MDEVACVASVSVWFRSKERPRNGILGFGRARSETRAIFRAVFDSRSSFFAPKPLLATQAVDEVSWAVVQVLPSTG